MPIHVIGWAPAATTRRIAMSCASGETPPEASVTTYTSYPSAIAWIAGIAQTHLRPQGGDDEFFPAGLLHCFDHAPVLPGIDEGAVDRLLIRKHRLNLAENL